jgi:hypothetical protein
VGEEFEKRPETRDQITLIGTNDKVEKSAIKTKYDI